jgi:hypothetical protein
MATKPRPSIYMSKPIRRAVDVVGPTGADANLSGRIATVAERFMAMAQPAMAGLGLGRDDWALLVQTHAADPRPLDLASIGDLLQALQQASPPPVHLIGRIRAMPQTDHAALAEALDRLDPALPIDQALAAAGIPA